VAGGYWPGSFAAGTFWVTGGVGGAWQGALERIDEISGELDQRLATGHDPDVYTRPWTGWFYMRFNPDLEPWEYVCQQANYAHELMVGQFDKVDRTTTIVP
jgi:hypothetical protein